MVGLGIRLNESKSVRVEGSQDLSLASEFLRRYIFEHLSLFLEL